MTLNDAAQCRQIVRTYARTFWLASRFLPADKRRAAFALYAFCRVADDIVDLRTREDVSDAAALLRRYRIGLDDALAGRPGDAVFRELAAAAQRYRVPGALLHELLDGVARDCAPTSFGTWSELSHYCEGVASSVGEMCTYVFGVHGDDATRVLARAHARTLGIAMQLTNILRDVGEDARNGRCYLPIEDLGQFGMSREQLLAGTVVADDSWKALMRFEIVRARALYEKALPGIALLAADTRRCAMACAVGYAEILGAIERMEYDNFRSRARLSARARANVLFTAWRTPLDSALHPSSGDATANGGAVATWS